MIGLRILSRGCASGTLSIALAAVLLRSNRIFAAYASRVKFLRAASRDKYTVRHYSLTALDPNFTHVMSWIHRRDVQYELHLARVRFWVPEGVILTEFLLQFADSCSLVDPSLDLATGLPLTEH